MSLHGASLVLKYFILIMKGSEAHCFKRAFSNRDALFCDALWTYKQCVNRDVYILYVEDEPTGRDRQKHAMCTH
jgi:hypothetical protein